MYVLKAGQDLTSPEVIRSVGPTTISGYHYAYDTVQQLGGDPPKHLQNRWEEFCALVEREPERTRHNRTHAGHCTYVLPEEETFVTPDLIRMMCFVGSGPEIISQLEALDSAGLDQVMILPSLESRYEVLEDVGREVLAKL